MVSCPTKRKIHKGSRGGRYYVSKGRKIYCKSSPSRKDYSKVKIGPLRKGSLTRHGYKASKSARARHIALNKAVKAEGALAVYRKLNAVMVLNKNTNPTKSTRFRADRNWIKRKYL